MLNDLLTYGFDQYNKKKLVSGSTYIICLLDLAIYTWIAINLSCCVHIIWSNPLFFNQAFSEICVLREIIFYGLKLEKFQA